MLQQCAAKNEESDIEINYQSRHIDQCRDEWGR